MTGPAIKPTYSDLEQRLREVEASRDAYKQRHAEMVSDNTRLLDELESYRKARDGDNEGVSGCEWCGGSMAGRRADARFCCEQCGAASRREKAHTGTVASSRRLKGGRWSVVVHMSKDVGIEPGQAVRIAE